MLHSRSVPPRHLDRARQRRHRRDARRRRLWRRRQRHAGQHRARCGRCSCRTCAAWASATSSRWPAFAPDPRPRALSAAARWRRRARTPPPDIGRWPASIWTNRFRSIPHGFPRGDHGRVREPHRPQRARQQGRLRHRDHQGTRRRAHAHRLADRLHIGRQRLPGRRARGGDSRCGSSTRSAKSRARFCADRTKSDA